MKSLSILLPTYNCRCVDLVTALHSQCEAIKGLRYEIIVADDGSPRTEFVHQNKAIERLRNVEYIVRTTNVGRSRIRNYLVTQAQNDWILFIDGDLELANPTYIQTFLEAEGDLIVGGIAIAQAEGSLRWLAEKAHEAKNTAQYRSRHALELHTNFLVRRKDLLARPFDEAFTRYGYEDVMLGKALVGAGLAVNHIDNPVLFAHFESNASFLKKTDEALETLVEHREQLRSVNHLLPLMERLEGYRLLPLLRFCYKISEKWLRKRLTGNNPNLFLFKMYRVLRYAHLTKTTMQ